MKRLIIFLLTLFSGTLFASDGDQRQVRSLADRGQFEVVESLCQEKFQQPDIADIDKVRLATELVRSRSMQWLVAETAHRTRIIRQIESLEATWLVSLPLTQREKGQDNLALAKIVLRLHCAMAYQSLGDYQRFEADAASETNKQTAYQAARTTLQNVLERLITCQEELQTFRQRVGINASPQLQSDVLTVNYSITLQRGITLKSLALSQTTEAERNVELRQAAEVLSELASKNNSDPVIVRGKIEKAACHRLCGELPQCAEILTQLLNAPEYRLQIEAEWIRYQIAVGNIVETRQRYVADRADSRLHPDFDLARLELFLANDPTRRIRPEIPSAMKIQETMARQLGPYWKRRAEMTVSTLSKGNTDLVSTEMLATLADSAFRENRFVASAEHYEQAAAKANANRQTENMFRYNRLAIEAWRKALERAPSEEKTEYRKRLISLLQNQSLLAPTHTEAENLHLWAIDLQGQIVLTQPESQNNYLALIKEHMETWQESPQMPRLRRLSVIILERQGRIDEAAAMLPLLDLAHIETLPREIQRLWVLQLDTEGKTQAAVDILTTLLKQKREPATLQLLAEILSRQTDAKSLEYALTFWTELAESVPKNSETWWVAREEIFDVLCRLSRYEEAKKSFDLLRLSYPDLGGAERKERLKKRFAE